MLVQHGDGPVSNLSGILERLAVFAEGGPAEQGEGQQDRKA
jgi:hypothetical protein